MLKLYELDVHGEEGTGCRLLGLWPSAPLCELLRTEGFGFSSTGNLQGQFSLLSYRSGWPVQKKVHIHPCFLQLTSFCSLLCLCDVCLAVDQL